MTMESYSVRSNALNAVMLTYSEWAAELYRVTSWWQINIPFAEWVSGTVIARRLLLTMANRSTALLCQRHTTGRCYGMWALITAHHQWFTKNAALQCILCPLICDCFIILANIDFSYAATLWCGVTMPCVSLCQFVCLSLLSRSTAYRL